ncbi:MAG TPA: putative DNA modification/repair radical SAM protein [Anaerolineaceae bacterium]|nr:putative DNA modification/repair radical SAM protein [Anaerolineaceae bacterium]
METQEKLHLLSLHNNLEMQEGSNPSACPINTGNIYVSHATLPNGKKMRLFKSLISSRCSNNCYYCPIRKDSNHPRASFQPEEYAALIHNLYHAGLIDGAFISSAVEDNPVRTQDTLIKAMEILRLKYHFTGYLHVKLMPGVEFEQARHVMLYADRVSLNLEAPSADRIALLSPDKTAFEKLLDPLKWTHYIKQYPATPSNWKGRWPSVCTQFVVGGSEESDTELLQTTAFLYNEIQLQRAYFSPLQPYSSTPMKNHAAIPLKRKLRLYQASFLIRDYGYTLEDFSFDQQANLPLEKDPKVAWAEAHLREAPVEINQADLETLIRIPGIGTRGAKKIIQLRSVHPFCDAADFSKAGIRIKNGLPFITMNGKQSIIQPTLPLFS